MPPPGPLRIFGMFFIPSWLAFHVVGGFVVSLRLAFHAVVWFGTSPPSLVECLRSHCLPLSHVPVRFWLL